MAKIKAVVLKLLVVKVSMTWNRSTNDKDGRWCDKYEHYISQSWICGRHVEITALSAKVYQRIPVEK
jgi:hypothetical protein